MLVSVFYAVFFMLYNNMLVANSNKNVHQTQAIVSNVEMANVSMSNLSVRLFGGGASEGFLMVVITPAMSKYGNETLIPSKHTFCDYVHYI